MRSESLPPARGSIDVGIGEMMRCLQMGLPPPADVPLGARFDPMVSDPSNERIAPARSAVPATTTMGVASSTASMAPPVSHTCPASAGMSTPVPDFGKACGDGDKRFTSAPVVTCATYVPGKMQLV